MWAEFATTGGLRRFEVDSLSLLLYPASELQDGLVGLYLRRRDGGMAPTALFGAASPSRIGWLPEGPTLVTEIDGIRAVTTFCLSTQQRAWFWHVRLSNTSKAPREVDLVYTHDVALAPYEAVRANGYYVSQYLDLTPLEVPGHGTAIAVRQNMPGSGHPWALIGCLGRGTGWATDALQLTGRGRLEGESWPGLRRDLPSVRLQGEHTLATLQSAPIVLAPGASADSGFFGIVVGNHPAATGPEDAATALWALADAAAKPPPTLDDPGPTNPIVSSLFVTAPVLVGRPDEDRPPADAQHVEESDGRALSWFTSDGRHVVTEAKERVVLRPHGHLLRTGSSFVPDERALTATTWMAGTFLSHLSQGHLARGSVVSLRRTYLALQPAHGLRLFADGVDPSGGWVLLGVPTRWEITTSSCRWRYAATDRTIEVLVIAPSDAHEIRLRVTADTPTRFLFALQCSLGGDDGQLIAPLPVAADLAGVTIGTGDRTLRLVWPPGSVEWVAGDGPLRADGRSAGEPWVTAAVAPTTEWSLAIIPQLVPAHGPDVSDDVPRPRFWTETASAIRLEPAAGGPVAAEVERITAVIPWFAHNALIHYLSPHGLEQYSGGGWGTRDVAQGPIGLLMALGEYRAMRNVVVRLLRAQNVRGDWPQWFEFYRRHAEYRQRGAHGDVVYWPLLALGEYLAASGDAALLDERIPFVGDGGPSEESDVLEHVARALDVIEASWIPGTMLPAYGHGDWNDSLQPADPQLAARLVSSWTVTLQAHALGTLARALEGVGGHRGTASDTARRARVIADASASQLRELLVVDGVLAGYGEFDPAWRGASPQRPAGLLVHPRDRSTGLTYSLLPMIHAISWDLLPPDLAAAHLRLIEEHLMGPDGARLFDRPVAYCGGPMRVFQRAEAASFFGREIGLMYTHAHLRYAEALARVGDAEGCLRAMAVANPIGITDRVTSARPRQATTYFSSSDAAFPDRYAAADGYGDVLAGRVPFEAGWRVYSSGPGLYLRLIVEQLLGIRRRGDRIEIDPVLPVALDGLLATVPVLGRPLSLRYRVRGPGCGVGSIRLGGRSLATEPLTNPYRRPGVAVRTADVAAALGDGREPLTIEVG